MFQELKSIDKSLCLIAVDNSLVFKDLPLSVMIKDSSGKIDPYYLAYNVYNRAQDTKYEIVLSRPMKFRKEIYYQIFNQVIVDIFGQRKYLPGSDVNFLSEVSIAFKQHDYKLFKLVPLNSVNNKMLVWNTRVMKATIGNFNYYACNFSVLKSDTRKRKSFLLWREPVEQ